MAPFEDLRINALPCARPTTFLRKDRSDPGFACSSSARLCWVSHVSVGELKPGRGLLFGGMSRAGILVGTDGGGVERIRTKFSGVVKVLGREGENHDMIELKYYHHSH
jgi:hypothetical protein